ncbi:MAG TPA: MFS transporter [Pseudolabrys sp.]|nr:MFS transporter [Pseudolabrys sp.]
MLESITAARADPDPGPTQAGASAGLALTSLSLSVLLSSLGTSIANVGLPTLAQAFNAPFQQVQWVVIAYLLSTTTLVVSAGRLGDMIGRRRLLLTGLAMFTLSSLLCGAASTLWLLIAARALQGLGAAIMLALAMASVGEAVAKDRIGGAMGLLGTMSAVGTALGPSLGGVLIAAFGWRAIFLAGVPIGILTFFLAQYSLPADRRRPTGEPMRFDAVGTLLLALTLAAYALAVTLGRGRFGMLNMALLLSAVVGVALFLRVEARVPSPLIRMRMFGNRALSASLAMSTLVAAVMMTTFVVGPFYLARALGLNAALVGLVLAVGPMISIISGIPSGRIVDRLGAPTMVAVGLTLLLAGALALVAVPSSFGVVGYIAGIAVLTPGYQLFQAANNTVVMADAPQDQRGVISGLLNLSRNLGLITGSSVMGAVFALASTASDVATAAPGAITQGMRITFGVAGALMLVALIIAITERRRSKLATTARA